MQIISKSTRTWRVVNSSPFTLTISEQPNMVVGLHINTK